MSERRGQRQFSDRETALILKRAAELEARTGSGHTLTEIQSIAREVGIHPELVARAAAELPYRQPPDANPLLGGATAFRAQRLLPVDVSEDDLSDLVSTIRQTMGKPGEVTHLPGMMEWKVEREAEYTDHVEVNRRQGGTTISVTSDHSPVAGWIFGGVLAGSAIAGVASGAVLESVLVGATMGAGTLSAGWIAARAAWRSYAAKLFTRNTEVLEAVEARALEIGMPVQPTDD